MSLLLSPDPPPWCPVAQPRHHLELERLNSPGMPRQSLLKARANLALHTLGKSRLGKPGAFQGPASAICSPPKASFLLQVGICCSPAALTLQPGFLAWLYPWLPNLSLPEVCPGVLNTPWGVPHSPLPFPPICLPCTESPVRTQNPPSQGWLEGTHLLHDFVLIKIFVGCFTRLCCFLPAKMGFCHTPDREGQQILQRCQI